MRLFQYVEKSSIINNFNFLLALPDHGVLADADADEDTDAHAVDLTYPASWFPSTRTLRRRMIAHLGPTNSGMFPPS